MFQIKKFATRLKKLRAGTKESQQVIADLLGVTTAQISDMENGKTTTSFERLVMLCEHFQVSADYLLGLKDEK